jgi:hypothetical protein
MVTVVVVPYTREGTVTPVPGTGFLQTVSRHLDELRLITTDVHIIGPEYVKISVKCTVHPRKRSCPDKVEQRVQEALDKFLDPLRGGPDEDGWPFGRSVFPSEIYQTIEKVEGVDYATAVSIIAEGQHRKEDEIIRIPPMALIYSGKHRVVAGARKVVSLTVLRCSRMEGLLFLRRPPSPNGSRKQTRSRCLMG